jgi:hypothetical protein
MTTPYAGHGCQRHAMDNLARQFGLLVLAIPTGQGLLIR